MFRTSHVEAGPAAGVGSYHKILRGDATYDVYTHVSEASALATMWFPETCRCTIPKLDVFCETINNLCKPDASIAFDDEANTFSISVSIKAHEIEKGLQKLMAYLDYISPLLVRVIEIGQWNEQLLNLAFIEPEDMWQA